LHKVKMLLVLIN